MKTKVLAVLIAVIAGHVHGYASAVTLDDYLDRVRLRHPFFAGQQLKPDIAALHRDRFLGDKDWVLKSAPFINFQEPIIANTFSPERITRLNLNARAERAYWGNGSRLALTLESIYTDQKVPGIVIPSSTGPIAIPVGTSTFFENRLVASYSYPLLQNNGGILDQTEYYLADENIDFTGIESMESQEVFLLEIGIRFVDWALVLEQMRISQERLQFEQEELEQIRQKRAANLVDEVDVLRGLNAVEVAEENLVFNRSRMRAKRAELATLARDETINTDSPELDIYAMDSIPAIDVVLKKIPGQRRIRALRVRVEQLKIEHRALESVSRAELFVGVAGGVQQGNADFVKAWSLNQPDLTLFFDFRYPLGNRTATADVEANMLELRLLEAEIGSATINLEAELRRIWIEITELENVLELNRAQVATATRKTVEEQRVYDQGRGDLTFVIQSRDEESFAEFRYAVNAATYQKLLLNYRALVDELLPPE